MAFDNEKHVIVTTGMEIVAYKLLVQAARGLRLLPR